MKIDEGKLRRMAADFVAQLAERFALDVCEDWEFPEDWTTEERLEAEKAYHQWNGDPEEFDPEHPLGMQSSMAASLCAAWLRGDIEEGARCLDS